MTLMFLFAYITIGLTIGWLSNVILKERSIKMLPSLLFGVFGALIGTGIDALLNLPGAAFYAIIGAIGILFTLNAFRQMDPIFTTSGHSE